MNNKWLIVIAGPTAIGKTAIAIDIAQHYNTAVLSADSRQCYKEMQIGTAVPSKEELAMVPHYFIQSHSILEPLNAAAYEKYALETLDALFKKHDVVVVCGGTGLYINALCNGIDIMPETDSTIIASIQHQYDIHGLEWLQNECKTKDPEFWEQAEQQNPTRLIRALAFHETNNTSITNYKTGIKKTRPFNIIKIRLEMDRALLYYRINQRVENMLEEGLLNEVLQLKVHKDLKNLQTVGYAEFYQHPHFPNFNQIDLNQIKEKIQQHTRNYAKRQITWFKNDVSFISFDAQDKDRILNYLHQQIQ